MSASQRDRRDEVVTRSYVRRIFPDQSVFQLMLNGEAGEDEEVGGFLVEVRGKGTTSIPGG